MKALGRERVEPLLISAIQRQQGPKPPYTIKQSNGVAVVPRTFYTLIEPDLVRLGGELKQRRR